MELCGGGLAEFIPQGHLGLLLLCNFSQSHFICLGMWLHSALRNTSLSTVTLIPPFLLSHFKNNELKKSSFYWQGILFVPLVIRRLHPRLVSSSWMQGMPKNVQAYKVLQVLLEHLSLRLGESPKCPGLGDRSFSASSVPSVEREGDDDWTLHSFRCALPLNHSLEEQFLKCMVSMVLRTVNDSEQGGPDFLNFYKNSLCRYKGCSALCQVSVQNFTEWP